MTDETIIDVEPSGRVTRRDLVEGKIGKVLDPERSGLVQVTTGLQPTDAFQVAESAKLMATCGPMLPPWLQGNVGGCWGIILRATELGISPLTLAQMTFVTEKGGIQRLGYDSVYFRMMVEKFAPIKGRLQARYEGEGNDLVCIVYATFKGETEPREFPPKGQHANFTLGKLRPKRNEYGKIKGSPLWDDKPELQMFYSNSRDWARMYCSDIVAGVYSKEELNDAGYEDRDVVQPTDLSPRVRERLRGQTGEGFAGAASIEAALAEATPVDTKKKKSGDQTPPGEPIQAAAASGSEAAPSAVHPASPDGAANQPLEKSDGR